MADILQKMIDADVIVLPLLKSPVYFYSIGAQLKAVIDRTRWHGGSRSKDKEFYYITTMADEENPLRTLRWPASGAMQTAWKEPWKRESFVACGVYEPGAVRNTSAMAQAYEMGRNV